MKKKELMNKSELIGELASARGIKKKEAEEKLNEIDEMIEFAKEVSKKTGKRIKLGTYYTVEFEHIEEKKGEITRINECGEKVKTPYVTEAHDSIKIKPTQAAKRF